MRTILIVVLTAAAVAGWRQLALGRVSSAGCMLAVEIVSAVCWLAAATALGFDVVARYAELARSAPANNYEWTLAYAAVPLRCAIWGTVFGCAVALRIAKAARLQERFAAQWQTAAALLLLVALFAGGGCTGGFWLGDSLR